MTASMQKFTSASFLFDGMGLVICHFETVLVTPQSLQVETVFQYVLSTDGPLKIRTVQTRSFNKFRPEFLHFSIKRSRRWHTPRLHTIQAPVYFRHVRS